MPLLAPDEPPGRNSPYATNWRPGTSAWATRLADPSTTIWATDRF